MKRYIVLALLAVLTVTGAVLEGLSTGLPQFAVQASGLLTIVCAMIFVIWTLKIQADELTGRHWLNQVRPWQAYSLAVSLNCR